MRGLLLRCALPFLLCICAAALLGLGFHYTLIQVLCLSVSFFLLAHYAAGTLTAPLLRPLENPAIGTLVFIALAATILFAFGSPFAGWYRPVSGVLAFLPSIPFGLSVIGAGR